jgi:hypothetical protein
MTRTFNRLDLAVARVGWLIVYLSEVDTLVSILALLVGVTAVSFGMRARGLGVFSGAGIEKRVGRTIRAG